MCDQASGDNVRSVTRHCSQQTSNDDESFLLSYRIDDTATMMTYRTWKQVTLVDTYMYVIGPAGRL